MALQIQLRRDTSTNWTSSDPTLAQGEIGIETNTGKFKIGTGSTAWTSLAYATSDTASVATNLAGGAAGRIPYQTGSNTTAFVAVGSSGQVLISNGTSAPTWSAPPTSGFNAFLLSGM